MQNRNNCVGSYNVSGYTRADGTQVSSYTRTCGAAHLLHEDEQSIFQKRANTLFYNTEDKKVKATTIAGVEKGKPMSYEQANGGRVNPEYNPWVKNYYSTNCQSCIAVFEARMRGYDVEIAIPKGIENMSEVEKLKDNPNIAYIEPMTGKIPEFTTLKVYNKEDCESVLKSHIKSGERYAFSFKYAKTVSFVETGHIVEVWKNNNNELIFYDPQIGKHYNSSLLNYVKFKFDRFEEQTTPKILRVDDKELNPKIMNIIAKSARKTI